MTTTDAALLIGQLISAWSIGFTGGFLITRFKEAMNHVS